MPERGFSIPKRSSDFSGEQGHDVVQAEEWALAMRQQPLTSWQARGRL